LADGLLVVLGAALYSAAIPPLGWSWAGWFALAPLIWVARRAHPKRAAAAGFAYGVLICLGVAWWLPFAMSAYFRLPLAVDLLLTFAAYGLYVGVYTALAAAGWSLIMRRGRCGLRWLAVPAIWVMAEFARSTMFAGFSWEILGYAAYRDLRLIQIADLTGVYGLSFLMALFAYAVTELIAATASRRSRGTRGIAPFAAPAALLGAVTLGLCYGQFRLREYRRRSPGAPSLTIALVKIVPIGAERFEQVHYASTMTRYARLTQRALAPGQAQLVVWPEFALGFYIDREIALRAQLGQLARALNSALLIGAPRFEMLDGAIRYYNSAYLFSAQGALEGSYDKIRLLPFAEYQPSILPKFTHLASGTPNEFTAGRSSTVFMLPKGALGVLICYEATYPSLARRLAAGGAQLLVNISNDAWLTRMGGAAALQHLSMAVFRAVENRRALALNSTAGVSGFIDPAGGLHQLSTRLEGMTVANVPLCRDLTFYTQWGDWFAWACIAAALTALATVKHESTAP